MARAKARGGDAIVRRGPAPVPYKKYEALERRTKAKTSRTAREAAAQEEVAISVLTAGFSGFMDGKGYSIPDLGPIPGDVVAGIAIGMIAPRLNIVKGRYKDRARAIGVGLLAPSVRNWAASGFTMGEDPDDEAEDLFAA